jgi:uncharacterized protein (DUF983 family)
MNTTDNDKKPGLLNVLACKCPRCRRGDMFKTGNAYNLRSFMKMNDKCPVCGQVFDMEPGFYYGTSYVSYAFTIAISVATFIAWWVFVGISISDNRIFWWIPVNAVILLLLQPPLMRMARAVWLAFFVHYDRKWYSNAPQKPYSENKELRNAW